MYTFMFTLKINLSNIEIIENVNKTDFEVFYLINQLLFQKSFKIFMDNYFSNVNLFLFLWLKGFSAYNTVRINMIRFFIVLKKEKDKQIIRIF